MKKPYLNNLLPEHRTKIFSINANCHSNTLQSKRLENRLLRGKVRLASKFENIFHNNLLNNVLQIFTDLF